MISATSDLQVALILSTSFQSVGISVQEKKCKTDFQDGGHGGHFRFLIKTILATFDLQVNLIFSAKFPVNWPSGSGTEVQN